MAWLIFCLFTNILYLFVLLAFWWRLAHHHHLLNPFTPNAPQYILVGPRISSEDDDHRGRENILFHRFKVYILACPGGSGLLCYCQGSCPDGRKNGTCEAALDAGCFASAEEVGFSLVPWSAYSPNQVLNLNIKPLGLWLGYGHSGRRANVRVSSSGRSWPYDVSWRSVLWFFPWSLVLTLDGHSHDRQVWATTPLRQQLSVVGREIFATRGSTPCTTWQSKISLLTVIKLRRMMDNRIHSCQYCPLVDEYGNICLWWSRWYILVVFWITKVEPQVRPEWGRQEGRPRFWARPGCLPPCSPLHGHRLYCKHQTS